MSLRRDFRNLLIRNTISHAADRIPAYARILGNIAPNIVTVDDLSLLPIVVKSDMLECPEEFRDAEITTSLIQHTKGTTDKPFVIQRSGSELEFIQDLFGRLNNDDLADAEAPVCISLTASHHGDPTPVPYSGQVHQLSVTEGEISRDNIVSRFLSLSDFSGPWIMTGLESEIRILTCCLIESRFDFSCRPPTALITTGDLITARLREWYRDVWSVEPTSRYSITEAFGGASPCANCGYLHFDPCIAGEVVDPFLRTPISSGYGALVITTLYPFVQKQPMIRYWTGDLVEIGPSSCPIDELGFSYCGRISRSILSPGEPGAAPLLSSALLYDILDNYPDVASSQMFRNIQGLSDYSMLGHLKFSVDINTSEAPMTVILRIELRYPHYAYAPYVQQLRNIIYADILKHHPRLASFIERNEARLVIDFSLPGELWSFMPDEIEYIEG